VGRPTSSLHIELPATYNRPSNAFNLGRVTMKPDEWLWDRFLENRNTCLGVWDDQVINSYKKGLRDHKVFEKIHKSGATITLSSDLKWATHTLSSDMSTTSVGSCLIARSGTHNPRNSYMLS
jgi:hypothetical protein